MNFFLISIITFIMTLESSHLQTQATSTIDNDFFKNEINETIMDFAIDIDVDTNSIYIPFRD